MSIIAKGMRSFIVIIFYYTNKIELMNVLIDFSIWLFLV